MSRLLLQCSALSKRFAYVPLFEDISLSIHEGELFALIGENGSGKTTLLQLLAGLREPDAGNFTRQESLSVGFLPQEIDLLDPLLTVKEFMGAGVFTQLENEMALCLEESSRLEEWSELHAQYERLGGYRRTPIEQLFSGLKLNAKLLELSMGSLSSGERLRIALAKILTQNPDLLLLDEPTNHLDREMIVWLETLLKKRKGACVIVSHDRRFLNACANRLIEIKNGQLTCYGGNYDFYLEEQHRMLERAMQAYEVQQEERARLKQQMKAATFSKSKPTPCKDRNIMAYDKRGEKHQKSVQHKLNQMKERLEEIDAHLLHHPGPTTIKGLHFVESALSSSCAIVLENVGKAYGKKVLFSNVNQTVCKGDRIVITGPNGCGKTTLLKAIAGVLPVDAGTIRLAPTAKLSFLDQEVELLPMEKTPLEYFESRYLLSEEQLRGELHKLALGGTEVLGCPFSALSTGQRKRMMLLCLVLEKPNILLLDEPTNHFDFNTVEALEKALLEFSGAIIAVSHDVTFIEKIATKEWRLSF